MEHLRREELRRLLEVARAHRERDFVWILIGFWHALRISELVGGESRIQGAKVYHPGLTSSHFQDGYLTVQRLKGSLRTCQRLVEHADPLFDERAAVSDWIRYRQKMGAGDREPLFPTCGRKNGWKLMRLYCRRAEIPEHLAHPHILKHSMGMLAIAEGIEYARQRLGHKSIASTGNYLKVSDAEADDAIARLVKNMAQDFYRPSRIPAAAAPAPAGSGGDLGTGENPTREEIGALKALLAKLERGQRKDPARILEEFQTTAKQVC